MHRIRIADAQNALIPLCVMRRSYGDEAVWAHIAIDDGMPLWARCYAIERGHRTPTTGYDTIVMFTNGVTGIVHDSHVEDALAQLGLREVRT